MILDIPFQGDFFGQIWKRKNRKAFGYASNRNIAIMLNTGTRALINN